MISTELLVSNILSRLLRKADEGKLARVGASTTPFAPYLDPKNIGLAGSVNEIFKQLETQGLIKIKWLVNNTAIQYIEIADADGLAQHLGRSRLGDIINNKLDTLDSELSCNSAFQALRHQIVEQWLKGQQFALVDVSEGELLIDRFMAAEALLTRIPDVQTDFRHFASDLFGDSKRFSSIKHSVTRIVKMVSAEIDQELSADELFAHFGVMAILQPIYISGDCTLHANDASISCAFPPSICIFPGVVDNVTADASITRVTTIENQASFLKYCDKEKQSGELVIYTAGIPTPAFLQFYQLISETFKGAWFRHWGDIDVGGFFILSQLNKTITAPVEAFRMHPYDYINAKSRAEMTEAELKRLSNIQVGLQNEGIRDAAILRGNKYEQEAFRG